MERCKPLAVVKNKKARLDLRSKRACTGMVGSEKYEEGSLRSLERKVCGLLYI